MFVMYLCRHSTCFGMLEATYWTDGTDLEVHLNHLGVLPSERFDTVYISVSVPCGLDVWSIENSSLLSRTSK